MTKVLINAEVYTGEKKIKKGFLRYDSQVIETGTMDEFRAAFQDEVVDLKDRLIIPGFIDIHTHGGYGIDYMDGSVDEIKSLSKKLLQEGITSFFPTTMTQSAEAIEQRLKTLKKAQAEIEMLKGIHLEGPFISKDYKGAQNESHIIPPNKEQLESWYNKSGNLIKLVTYAPETADVREFEAYCISQGIILSAGHTGALYKQLVNSKAQHITHLFNAQRTLHHREAGVSGYGLLNDFIKAELIADGLHVSKEMVGLAYKLKGAEGIFLITDSMRAKGLGDGESELGGQRVLVKNGEARLEDGSLAGSVLTFIEAFRNIITFTGCTIEEAVLMSSVNQAGALGLTEKGTLKPGKDADFLILSKELNLENTILGGKKYARDERN